jgi:DNA (cytosine-5)-methyltransferase 1
LPALENNESKNKYKSEPLNEYQKIMRGFCVDYGIAKPAKLSNHVAPNHPADTVAKIASTKPGEPMYTKFKQRIRLALDKPSPTQLAGGIRPQFQFGHPTQPRGLSIRERARIQSFPDSYIFVGGIVQERVQTGNAVPPLMIYELVKPIANDLDKKYKKK